MRKNTYATSALRRKRAELAGQIIEMERQVTAQRKLLAHLDATLKLFEPSIVPKDIKPKRPYVRLGHYEPGEIADMVRDELRTTTGPISCTQIVDSFIAHKNIPSDAETRWQITRRVGALLRQMRLAGKVARMGNSRESTWLLIEMEQPQLAE